MTRLRLADAPAELLDDYAHLRSPDRRVAIERERGCFIVEGRFALESLLRSRYPLRSVLADERHAEALADLVPAPVPVLVAAPAEIEALAGFAFHRGLLAAAARLPDPSLDEVTAGARRLLVIEGVNDHENLGALYRNAAALGADAVVLDPTAADPLYRRTVRVSMGAALLVPTARAESWPGVLHHLRAGGVEVLALTPATGAVAIDAVAGAIGERIALLVGAEGAGLSAVALAAADHQVCIPMAGGVDSLNVATAAAIALHVLRER